MKKCIILVGPSGSGKNTLALELEKLGYVKLVTSTTRDKRERELEDVDYHFVNEIVPEDYVEWIEYAGNRYGLSKKEVEDKLAKNDKVYIIMNIDGYRALKELIPYTKSIGLYLRKDVLIERLKIRGEDQEVIRKRLIQYEKEKDDYKKTDYQIDANVPLQDVIKKFLKIIEGI